MTVKIAPQPASKLTLKFRVIMERDGDSFHAYCPAFKGLHVDGATEKEAFSNVREAAVVYLNSLAAHQEALPIGPDCFFEEDQIPEVPPGALLSYLELQWPSQNTSGIN
jgi:predicted RNase H-like HicB family nuclease